MHAHLSILQRERQKKAGRERNKWSFYVLGLWDDCRCSHSLLTRDNEILNNKTEECLWAVPR